MSFDCQSLDLNSAVVGDVLMLRSLSEKRTEEDEDAAAGVASAEEEEEEEESALGKSKRSEMMPS